MRDKYTQKIYDKYVMKVNHIIDVVKSCETKEQLKAAIKWGNSLFNQWKAYEEEHRKCGMFTWYKDNGPCDQFNTFIDWTAYAINNLIAEKGWEAKEDENRE